MIPSNRLADHLPLWDVTSSGYLRDLPNRFNDKAIKTVNNVLTVLNTLLKKAAEWRVIDDMPCTIRLLKVPEGSLAFYDFEEYEQMVTAAAKTSGNAYLIHAARR